MKESVTYQAILREGEAEGLRKAVLRLGVRHWGPPDAASRTALEGMMDPVILEQLLDRIEDVSSWTELLPPPPPPRRGKRKKSL